MRLKHSFLLLLLFPLCFSCSTKEEQIAEEITKETIDPEYQKQLMAYDISYVLSLYDDEIEFNTFIVDVDQKVKEERYKGYDIEYFQFHEFRSDIIDEMYLIFFSHYDFFTQGEQDSLIKDSQIHKIHTWNSKKKELALLGEHLSLLKEHFGEKSELFINYKTSYFNTANLKTTLNEFKKQKIENSYTIEQKQALLKILGPLLQLR